MHLTPSLVMVESSSKYAWFLGSVSMAFLQSIEPVVPGSSGWWEVAAASTFACFYKAGEESGLGSPA